MNLKKYLNNLDNKPDLIYTAYPTMTSAHIAGKYANNYEISFVLDIQDIWPEAFKITTNLSDKIVNILTLPLTFYANKIYSLADFIIGVSDTFVQRACKLSYTTNKNLVVYIGTDLEYFDQQKTNFNIEKNNQFWLTYIGTLSHSYDIKTVIKAVKEVEKEGYDDIKFKVIGTGPFEEQFKKVAKDINSPTEFLGYLKYEKMIPYLVNSDLALNALKKSSMGSVTNKLGDYLASGLPILNSGSNQEVRNMIENKKVGYNYKPGNVNELARLIIKLYKNNDKRETFSNNSRQFAEDKFDRNITYDKIYKVLENLIKNY